MLTPTAHRVSSRDLNLNVLEWTTQSDAPTLLLQHGFLDHARSWQFVADRMAQHYRVLAPDARGHGDSDWIGAGGYYHFQDYVYDLDAIYDELIGTPCILVGHSMGGMVTGYFAGAFPERVSAYISIEGLGPPDCDINTAPDRMRTWIEGVHKRMQSPRKTFANVDEAAARMRAYNPRLPEANARFIAAHGSVETADGWCWKFDPLHQTRSPQQFYLDHARAFWRRFTCPTMYIDGDASHFAGMVGDRSGDLPNPTHRTVTGAGHMIHHEQPEALAELIDHFIRAVSIA